MEISCFEEERIFQKMCDRSKYENAGEFRFGEDTALLLTH